MLIVVKLDSMGFLLSDKVSPQPPKGGLLYRAKIKFLNPLGEYDTDIWLPSVSASTCSDM